MSNSECLNRKIPRIRGSFKRRARSWADAALVLPYAAMDAPASDSHQVRHRSPVRLTHWVNVLTFMAPTVSGIGIVLAHPRFYWGEVVRRRLRVVRRDLDGVE